MNLHISGPNVDENRFVSSDDEPDFVPLTDRMLAVRGCDETPESLLLAKEMAGEGEGEDVERIISPKMRRAMLLLTAEPPERIWKMLDWLPIEEAYSLRRYVLNGHTQPQIARTFGVTKPAVHQRLYRALWRLHTLMDLAWDMREDQLRAAVGSHVDAHDEKLVVVFWEQRFSQSRTAEVTSCWQSHVRKRLLHIESALEAPAKKNDETKRVHWTLLQMRVKKLTIAATKPRKNAMRMPGGGR